VRIRKRYLWDVDAERADIGSESFRRFYIERILQNGTMDDIRDIGLPEIRRVLPRINLSREVRDFWEWYFDRHPEIRPAQDPDSAPGGSPP
jgi:hypothetical protein